MTYVEVCGIGFSGDHIPISGLVLKRLIGWDGLPDGRSEGDTIPTGHGSYRRVDIWRASRAITLQAGIVAESRTEFLAVKCRVEAMQSVGVMRVDHGDGMWERHVEVDQITIPDWHGRDFVEFTIDLIAPDPVRYSDVLTVGPVGLPVLSGGLFLPAALPWDLGVDDLQVAELSNTGELPILPKITVTGAADSVTVHGGPRRVSFGAFDGVLEFDSLPRSAFLNGADVTRSLVRRDWPVVPKGETQGFHFEAVNPSADLALTVEYRIGVW